MSPSATPQINYSVEVLSPSQATSKTVASSTVEISISSGVVTSLVPESYPVIEVTSYPPVGGGYNRVETLSYTKQGVLTTTTGGSEFPIGGGNFILESIAARVTAAPTGSAVILDVLKNDTSIFTVPANRPTIAPGTRNAVVGSFPTVMLVPGDWIEVTIVQVGSGSPGDTLVAPVRMVRIG